ncbi:hypothetical protein SK128_008897 [Halocaridina rubra]|uniref:MD-2-related lipid-recognition domain-containing protein n=1 Tax=Halocaridina rubra TaxID=373956 RepID=A0AAN8WY89_HALRR
MRIYYLSLSHLLLLLFVGGCVKATHVLDCGSVSPSTVVMIEDCDEPPCIISRPDNKDVNITFVAANDATDFETNIKATIGGVEFPWPGPGGCTLLVGDTICPLVSGVSYEYRAAMPVLSEYPTVEAVVRWELMDNLGNLQVCFLLPVIIT